MSSSEKAKSMLTREINPSEARALLDQGDAVLIDVREADEHARERIPGARSVPLSVLPFSLDLPARRAIFHCRSGARTAAAADRLAASTDAETYLLTGGIQAWKAAGYSVQLDRRRPIEIMRQVQIVAGGLILLGIALGALITPDFYALSGFVGAGLLFAGVTGTCGMARLLSFAPWNRI